MEKDIDTKFNAYSSSKSHSHSQNIDIDIDYDFMKSPFDNKFFKNFGFGFDFNNNLDLDLAVPKNKNKKSSFYSESIKTVNINGKTVTKKIINDNGKIYEQIIRN